MKRSEMIEHIAQELLYVAVDEGLYKTAQHGYFQRKAADLLDMIEGLGMLPPPYTFEQEVVNNPTGDTISVIDYDWEDEQ